VGSIPIATSERKYDMLSYCLGECCIIFHAHRDLIFPRIVIPANLADLVAARIRINTQAARNLVFDCLFDTL
jgi:hypothetical protein